jgi:RHS repeat-associated protein
MGPTSPGGTVTNILPASEQVTGPTWVTLRGTVTNSTVAAPDDTSTAQTLTASAGSVDSYLVDYIANPGQYSGKTVTASVYLRVASGTQNLGLFIINYGSSGYSVPNSEVVTLNTSWQRFDLTATNQAGLTTAYFQIGGGGTLTAGESISVWGAQMVVGSSQDNYVETQNTTTVTGSAQTLAANGLNQLYSYDSFGNLQSSGNYSFIQGYTAANQISGWNYDAAGNLLTDGLGSNYVYDGEGKIKSGAGVTYIYTAEGQRAEKSGSPAVDTIYFGGHPIGRLISGAWTDEIYGAGGLLAEVPGTQTGTAVYRMTDHLGSLVGTLSSTGSVLSTQDVGPFGEVFAGGSSDPFVFTGKERDAESGNDFFGARYYSNNIGRWMTPDWAARAEAVPYSDFSDPQSLNLYSYVGNNPVSRADAEGHAMEQGNSNGWWNLDGDGSLQTRYTFQVSASAPVLPLGAFRFTGCAAEWVLKSLGNQMTSGLAALVRTFQTYTRPSLDGGKPYSGKTSGTGTPLENIAKRKYYRPKTGVYGDPELDRSTTNPLAQRGREQQLIDANGGARSQGGTSGNAINGISDSNPNKQAYMAAADAEGAAQDGETVLTTVEILNDLDDIP